MKDEQPQPEKLDYARPERPTQSWRSYLATLFGLLALLLGAFMLYYGVPGIVWLVRERENVYSGDVFQVAMFNVIGIVAVVFGARCFKAAF